MALRAGETLGPYEILSALGAGGMGEVYRARDIKLNRNVALKVLPASVSADPDRIARFRREARLLASLNHPNIGHIYGVEDSTAVQALVLELIEGRTLAERIGSRPMPLDEALSVAWQIADAVAAAHAHGVIHRDLKPANVKLRPDGTVKVLDFGLAKALEPEMAETVAITRSAAPISPVETYQGAIVGSPRYMSPEQARGESLDIRTDIWSFGVVLFEMVTGVPPFDGRTASDSLAAVIHANPDFTRVPARVRPLLEACLQKDPRQRLRDIGDARLLVPHADTATPSRRSKWWLPWAVTAAAAAIAVVGAWAPWRHDAPLADVVRFQILPHGNVPVSGASAISPNGRYFAYFSIGTDGVMRVWVRDLKSFDDRLLQGTEISQSAPPPFWSPDSRFIAYDAGGALMKVDVGGGLPQLICPLTGPAIGGSWNRDGVILFGSPNNGIYRVPDGGGTRDLVTVPDQSRTERMHLMPVFLPHGRHFFYLRVSRDDPTLSGIYLGSLDVEPEKQNLNRLIATPTNVSYAPAGDDGIGQLLFVRDGSLFAQGFDERRSILSGSPVLVAEGVYSYLDGAAVSVSHTGVLTYRPAIGESQFSWFDRKGQLVRQFPERGLYGGFSLSSDANRVVASRVNPQVTATATLWLLDFAANRSAPVGTSGPSPPVLSHDGSRVAYTSYQSGFEGTFMMKAVAGGGSEEVLFQSKERAAPTSWSRDGRHLLFVAVDPKSNTDVWTLSLEGTRKASPFLQTAAAESQAQFSPAMTGAAGWVAFTSNESGRDEVYLTRFPEGARRVIVSTSGGHSPRWRGDGRELFYVASDGMLNAVSISGEGVSGQPVPLFRVPGVSVSSDATGRRLAMPWDVAFDGERFLFTVPIAASTTPAFNFVLNWQRVLPR